MKVELNPCYILHRRDYSESSLILEVFSREHGRINLIVKGAKQNRKRQGISHSLYQKYFMSWSAKSELGNLTYAELMLCPAILKPEYMMTGFYMNELILKLLHKHESHSELFDSYDMTIKRLIDEIPEEIALRYYEKTLLQSLGYGLILDHDVETGESLSESNDYTYKLDSGPTIKNSKSISKINISGKTLIELNAETLSDVKNINEAKILLRSILDRHLDGRSLASRDLYKAHIKNKNVQ